MWEFPNTNGGVPMLWAIVAAVVVVEFRMWSATVAHDIFSDPAEIDQRIRDMTG
jgi:hypothetical protein